MWERESGREMQTIDSDGELKLKTLTKLMARDATKPKLKLATKCFVQGSPKALPAAAAAAAAVKGAPNGGTVA